jgi:hypothetical protein
MYCFLTWRFTPYIDSDYVLKYRVPATLEFNFRHRRICDFPRMLERPALKIRSLLMSWTH